MSLEWMAWTPHTALFFIFILLLLVAMLIWELVSPTIERRGFLFIPTTRGTRLFIGLLGSGFIHLAWLALTVWSLWFALGIAFAWTVVVMRWG